MLPSLQHAQRQESDYIAGPLPDVFPAVPESEVAEDMYWLKTNILSLDGGGIRGYWTLLALEMLMDYIGRREEEEDERTYHSFCPQTWPANVSQIALSEDDIRRQQDAHNEKAKISVLARTQRYLPCHYFDHVCGPSTGALIAIMLGRFRMTVPDCKREYENLGETVFGKPRMFFTLRFVVGERFKYKAKRLEKVFKDVAKRRNEQPKRTHGRITMPSDNDLCKTCVTTRKREREGEKEGRCDSLYLIRSYNHAKRFTPRPTPSSTFQPSRANTGISEYSSRGRRKRTGLHDVNYEEAQDFEIWEVARAATAAPLFFEPFKIENSLFGGNILFTDGGFGQENNPVRDAKREIESLRGDDSIGIIVSAGTARKTRVTGNKWSALPRFTRDVTDKATDPEPNHIDMEREHTRCENDDRKRFSYYRLNNPGGLDIELDEWKPKTRLYSSRAGGSKTIEVINNRFNIWAKNPDNIQEIQQCAKELVEQRRRRMGTRKWERYATGARYECRETGCHLDCSQFDRSRFRNHLHQNHDVPEEGLEDMVQRCKSQWRYQIA